MESKPQEPARKLTYQEVMDMVNRQQASWKATEAKMEKAIQNCQETLRITESVQQNFQKLDDSYRDAMRTMAERLQGLYLGPVFRDKGQAEKYGLSRPTSVQEAARVIRSAAKVVILTGAGVSQASGLATYRGHGQAERLEVDGKVYEHEQVATYAFLKSNPGVFWRRYDEFFARAAQAEPNAGHVAIARLQRALGDKVTLVTQNIDGLHLTAYAGSAQNGTASRTQAPVLQVHGNVFEKRCDAGCSAALQRYDPASKQCDLCGGDARPNVLYFDESYNE